MTVAILFVFLLLAILVVWLAFSKHPAENVNLSAESGQSVASKKNCWKYIGLWISLILELLFWFLYLSLHLVSMGSPLGDILWLFSGVSGIVFGAINIVGCRKTSVKVLSLVALLMGIFLIILWMFAMFISRM